MNSVTDSEARAVGDALDVAYSALMRWSTRPDVRRSFQPEGEVVLSPTELWLLDGLAASGPSRPSDLAAWQGVDKSTISTQIQRLERAGLVERTPDAADRRAARISLTAEGETIRSRRRILARVVFEEILADWRQEDARQLATLLSRLAGALPVGPPTAGQRARGRAIEARVQDP